MCNEVKIMEEKIQEYVEMYSGAKKDVVAELLRYHFGIPNGEPKSIEETAKKFPFTITEIKQIERHFFSKTTL